MDGAVDEHTELTTPLYNTGNGRTYRLKFISKQVCKKLFSSVVLVSLLSGQILAILIAATGVASTYLSKQNIFIPLAQNYPHYTLLALIFAPQAIVNLIYRRSRVDSSYYWRKLSWKYLLAAILDVHGNWCLVAAYNYTSIVSVQLLDSFSIATAVFVSKIWLRTVYKVTHYIAIFGCILGMGLMIYSDYSHDKKTSNYPTNSTMYGKNSVIFGDFIAILGACFYGISNVLQEHLLRENDVINCIGSVSPFSSLLSLVYFLSLELESIKYMFEKKITNLVILSFCSYIAIMFSFSIVMAHVLKRTNAVLLNLSMLTADFYALLFGIFLYNDTFEWLYIVAFIVIIINVAVFLIQEPQQNETIAEPMSIDT